METVFVIALNRFFRESLLELFRGVKSLRVLGAADFSAGSAEQVARASPDVAVLNPESDDTTFCGARAIHQAAPRVKIMMVGMRDDLEIFSRAVHSGTVGYLLGSVAGKEIVAAIHQLGRKSVVYPSHLEWAYFNSLAAAGTCPDSFLLRDARSKFTGREREVASLLSKGLTNKEIADRLNLSLATVKSHLRNLSQKTDSKSRADIRMALEFWASDGPPQ